MPRYFFHVQDGRDLPDSEGTELPNDTAAKNQAIVLAGEMLKDLDGEFWSSQEWRLNVVQEDGAHVCALILSSR